MPRIRPIASGDIPALLRLDLDTPDAPHWGRLVYESFLPDDLDHQSVRHLFVAEENDRLTGFIAGRVVAGICELESIAVDAFARRAGLGTALLSSLIGWARACGAARVELEVRSANTAAISFYSNYGFRPDGCRPGYYRNPDDDAILMSLLLDHGLEA